MWPMRFFTYLYLKNRDITTTQNQKTLKIIRKFGSKTHWFDASGLMPEAERTNVWASDRWNEKLLHLDNSQQQSNSRFKSRKPLLDEQCPIRIRSFQQKMRLPVPATNSAEIIFFGRNLRLIIKENYYTSRIRVNTSYQLIANHIDIREGYKSSKAIWSSRFRTKDYLEMRQSRSKKPKLKNRAYQSKFYKDLSIDSPK